MNIFDVLNGVEIHPALFLAAPILIIIGFALKTTPKVPDWAIVWILLIVGAIFGGFGIGFTFEGIVNGLIAGASAIATHQAYKQTVNK